jgi:hypothetical protein
MLAKLPIETAKKTRISLWSASVVELFEARSQRARHLLRDRRGGEHRPDMKNKQSVVVYALPRENRAIFHSQMKHIMVAKANSCMPATPDGGTPTPRHSEGFRHRETARTSRKKCCVYRVQGVIKRQEHRDVRPRLMLRKVPCWSPMTPTSSTTCRRQYDLRGGKPPRHGEGRMPATASLC